MLQALSGMAKSRDVWPCNAGPPNGPGARRVSTTRQGCTATNCSGTCAKATGETVNKANPTIDKKTWRMEWHGVSPKDGEWTGEGTFDLGVCLHPVDNIIGSVPDVTVLVRRKRSGS